MTKTFISVLSIILCMSCKSNTENKKAIEKTQKHTDYIAYQRNISKAEKDILNENYTAALQHYDSAFALVKKPIANHCFTAMQVCASLDSLRHFKNYSVTAMKRGLLPKYFKEDSLLNGYLKEKNLYAFIDDHFEANNKIYEESINTFLSDTLTKLTELDQKWKRHYWDSLSRVDPSNKPKYDSLYNIIISDIVENKLIPLIKEHGYPGERKIGMYPGNYAGKDGGSQRRAYYNSSAAVILMHYYSLPQTCDFNNLYLEEVKKGNLEPSHFATFIDFQAAKGESTYCNVEHYNEWHDTKDSTQFEAINERRAKIGLDPFQNKPLKYKRGQKVCKELKEGKYKHIKLFYWCG